MGWSWNNIDWTQTSAGMVGLATLVQATVAVVMMRGLRHSEEASKTAAAALKLSRENAERQLRAYLDIAEVELQDPLGNPGLKVLITNTGQTPAYDLRTFISIKFVAPADVDAWEPDAEPQPQRRGLLPSGGKATSLYRFATPDWRSNVEGLDKRTVTVSAIIVVNYRDSYGRERTVRGRYYLMPDLHHTQFA